jgi:WD40 repeat protein
MTRGSFNGRPLIWLIFAVMIAVPSVQLARLLRVRSAARVEPAGPIVAPAGTPAAKAPDSSNAVARDSVDDPSDRFRYDGIGPTRAPINGAAISSSGHLIALVDDSGEVSVWDARARKRLSRFASEQRRPIWRYAPYGTPIAVDEIMGIGLQSAMVAVGGNDGKVRVWNVLTGKRWLTAPHSVRDASIAEQRRAPVVDVEAPSAGGIFSVSSNGSLALWNGRSDTSVNWITRSPGGNIRDVDLSSEAGAVAIAAEDGLYLLKVRPHGRTWTVIDSSYSETHQEFSDRMRANPAAGYGPRSGGSPQQVRFGPGGGVIASIWSTGDVRLYSVATLDRMKAIKFGRDHGSARLLAFSPDGKMLAASDGDRVIQVWSVGPITRAVALTAPRGPVRSMWFASDGQSIVVAAAGDRYLRILPVPEIR